MPGSMLGSKPQLTLVGKRGGWGQGQKWRGQKTESSKKTLKREGRAREGCKSTEKV